MADVSSITSGTERLRPLVLRAAEHGHVDELQALILQGKQEKTLEDTLLRWALQKAAERGQAGSVTLLLKEDVNWDESSGGDKGLTALYRAVQRGHKEIVRTLLDRGANTEAVDKNGRSVLHAAAWWNRAEILRMLIQAGANVNSRDREEKTVLHGLGADKTCRWSDEIIQILLATPIDIEYRDTLSRTTLHWAAVTGKEKLTRQLLQRKIFPIADVHAMTNRGKTALHLAAEAGEVGVVKILLQFGAEPMARSDGGWTALHNAAREGHIGVIEALIQGGCNVNVCTSAGMTPLHWAAQQGHAEAVKFLLKQEGVWRNSKDVNNQTPLLCAAMNKNAAEGKYAEVVKLLAPLIDVETLSHDALGACTGFLATIVDFGLNGHKASHPERRSVYEVLYGRDPLDPDAYSVTTLVKNVKTKPSFRWIHLPANNMAWVETLVTKAFIEDGAADVEGLKALQATFGQQHRGPTIYSRSMRPLCQRIQRSVRQEEERPALKPVQEADTSNTPSGSATPVTPKGNKTQENGTPKGSKNTPKSKNNKNSGKNNSNTSRKDRAASLPRGNMVLFVPYLHFETERRRIEMNRAIRESVPDRKKRYRQAKSEDEMMIRAYLHSSTQLHVRRSHDQFYLNGIDDEDDGRQTFFNHDRPAGKERKVLMVDQLWMWILGRDLIITSFPQRWQQPKNDPYNVIDSIIEGINSRSGDPIISVYDLATLITSRCMSVFDRHSMGNEDNRLLNMFESTVGKMAEEESALFSRFYSASAAATAWLKRKRRTIQAAAPFKRAQGMQMDQFEDVLEQTHGLDDSDDDDNEPLFVDSLLDVGKETTLLGQCKDAQDKLEMVQGVLEHQKSVLYDMQMVVQEDVAESAIQRRAILGKKFEEMRKKVDVHSKDVRRMHSHAEQTYKKIIPLLDLKQKHANAFEARFARDQAASTARQGQVIMVFTIVTIVFLPMSFIAAFFAINIKDFPSEGGGLSLSYVCKFVFPIGLAISIPLIAVAFSLNSFRAAQRHVTRSLRRHQRSPTSSASASLEDLSAAKLDGGLILEGKASFETEKASDGPFTLRRTFTGGSGWSKSTGRLRARFRDVEALEPDQN